MTTAIRPLPEAVWAQQTLNSGKTKEECFRAAVWTAVMDLSRNAKSGFCRMRLSSLKRPSRRAAALRTARRATHLRGKYRSGLFGGLVAGRGSFRAGKAGARLAQTEPAGGSGDAGTRMRSLGRDRSMCAWDDFTQSATAARRSLAQARSGQIPPFLMLSVPGMSAREHRRCSELWVRDRVAASVPEQIGRASCRERV